MRAAKMVPKFATRMLLWYWHVRTKVNPPGRRIGRMGQVDA